MADPDALAPHPPPPTPPRQAMGQQPHRPIPPRRSRGTDRGMGRLALMPSTGGNLSVFVPTPTKPALRGRERGFIGLRGSKRARRLTAWSRNAAGCARQSPPDAWQRPAGAWQKGAVARHQPLCARLWAVGSGLWCAASRRSVVDGRPPAAGDRHESSVRLKLVRGRADGAW